MIPGFVTGFNVVSSIMMGNGWILVCAERKHKLIRRNVVENEEGFYKNKEWIIDVFQSIVI